MFEAGSAQGFPLPGDEEHEVDTETDKREMGADSTMAENIAGPSDHDQEDHEDVPMSEKNHGDDEVDDDEEDDGNDGQGSDGDIDMKEVRRANRTSDDTPDSSSDLEYENYGRKMVAKRWKV